MFLPPDYYPMFCGPLPWLGRLPDTGHCRVYRELCPAPFSKANLVGIVQIDADRVSTVSDHPSPEGTLGYIFEC